MLAIINFKAYQTSTGLNAIKLAKICEKVAKKEKANIVVAVQPADILAVSGHVGIPVLAQHVDAVEFGAKTGWILPESVQQMGAVGSLINHSEHQIPLAQIDATIKRLKSLGMLSVCCADTPAKAAEIAKFNPDVIAIEPPELIGGNIAVSQAKPEVITQTTSRIKDIPVLCGAGVKTMDDVVKAVQLGAKGILVASGVTNAQNPEKALTQLVRGLK
jgi:triosephosphate isomerase